MAHKSKVPATSPYFVTKLPSKTPTIANTAYVWFIDVNGPRAILCNSNVY